MRPPVRFCPFCGRAVQLSLELENGCVTCNAYFAVFSVEYRQRRSTKGQRLKAVLDRVFDGVPRKPSKRS